VYVYLMKEGKEDKRKQEGELAALFLTFVSFGRGDDAWE
jgi:hypothetical protein